jgi:peptide/nickel transport system substrate-binding protein
MTSRIRRALRAAALPLAGPALAQTLTMATGGSVTSVDPHVFNAAPNSPLALHFFETLVDRTHDTRLQPGLATERRSVSPMVWAFKPRRCSRAMRT